MEGLTTGWLARRNAEKWPDEEAILLAGQEGREATVTHAAFDERTDRVANGLGDVGLDAGDTIGLYMQNGVEVLELYVGAMKAGVLPVPLNHRFQGQEVAYVLQDSDVDAVAFDILAKHTLGTLQEDGAVPADEHIYVGDEPPAYATAYETFRERASSETVAIVPSRLDDAVLLYTSGTTGDPKGCYLTHDNLLSQIETLAFSRKSWEDRADRTLLVLPLFHVGAVARYVADAYDADTTVLMQHFQPELVLETIEREDVTQGAFVPSMARMLLDVEGFEGDDLGSFEEFSIGAAPADRELKETIIDRFDCELREVFGQTELSPTTVMLSPDDVLEKPDAIGEPVQNVLVRVEDPETGEPVDTGEIGRICYKGPTVFRRYHDLPERNAAVFEDGWFKSGDLVRRDEDGFVYFAGREDDMIVSGGAGDEWGERVKAAVVSEADSDLSEAALIDYVKDRIAGFKAPKKVEFLESLPKGPTGKVEKSELVPE